MCPSQQYLIQCKNLRIPNRLTPFTDSRSRKAIAMAAQPPSTTSSPNVWVAIRRVATVILESIGLWNPSIRFTRITHNPLVMGGKPCIRSLRVTVGTVLGLLASGESRERILKAYPYLEHEDISEALGYAAWRLEEREGEFLVPP